MMSEQAESAQSILERLREYYDDKTYRDIRNAVDTAYRKGYEEGFREGYEEGLREGRKEKSLEVARNMKRQNLPVGQIVEATGLEADEIEKLQ